MLNFVHVFVFFFFNDTATTEIYTLSLHDALPILRRVVATDAHQRPNTPPSESSPAHSTSLRNGSSARSEEHTSELQSPCNLVCRLLLEKKNDCASRKSLRTYGHTNRKSSVYCMLY